MTCELAEGTKLQFLSSGMEIQPYELRTSTESARFSHMSAVVSREAGRYIADNMIADEPVLVHIQGSVQGRYMVDKNAVQMGLNDATVTLYDAWKVLYSGSVKGSWQDEQLRDVIDDIIDARNDVTGVISGVKHETEDASIPVRGAWGDAIGSGISSGLSTIIAGMTGIALVDTSITFDGVTVAEAMFEIERRFAVRTWVDKSGTFHYSNPAFIQYAQLGVAPGSESLRLSQWNVTVGSGHVSSVIYRSPLQYTQLSLPTGRFTATTPKDVYVYGRATLSGVSGDLIEEVAPIGANTPEAVEAAAHRRLILEYMDRRAGNIVFNGLASKDAGGLVDLSPGDFISSSSGPVGDCDRRIDSGTFVVQNVNHVISPRVGWEVTAHVAAVPTAGITTTSYIYNPESEETWEDIAAYEKSDARAATPFVDFIK